jgi:hypothetical protein
MRGGPVNLSSVTLINNTADVDNDGLGSGGGISAAFITLNNSILAENKEGPTTPSDCSGTFTSQGYNFIQTIGCTINGTTTGNITGQAPLLGPLQDNGGLTLTHAPLPGSPVIDKGNPATPGSGGNACPATDQRGVARPIGSRCDIGAVETNLSVYLPLVIKN